MNIIKQTVIQKYNEAIADLQRLRDAIDLIPDALAEIPGAEIYTTGRNLRVDLPMTASAFHDARRLLGRDWERGKWPGYVSDHGEPYAFFVHKATRTELTLCLRPDFSGATCERRQVGIKEVPVYETICHAATDEEPDPATAEYDHIKAQHANRPETSYNKGETNQ